MDEEQKRRAALEELERARPRLTMQEYRTLRGQIRAGHAEDMMTGLARIRRRKHGGLDESQDAQPEDV